jgi:hypothetical protein
MKDITKMHVPTTLGSRDRSIYAAQGDTTEFYPSRAIRSLILLEPISICAVTTKYIKEYFK